MVFKVRLGKSIIKGTLGSFYLIPQSEARGKFRIFITGPAKNGVASRIHLSPHFLPLLVELEA